MPTRRLAVRLTPDALRRIRQGHPWVFDQSIRSMKGEGVAGDLAVVFDDDNRFAAIGLFDPDSPIRIKVLHHGDPRQIDTEFWYERLAGALERRAAITADDATTGLRIVHGENDAMPGMVLDRYADTYVLKLYSTAWVPHLPALTAAVDRLVHPQALVLRVARGIDPATLGGLAEGDALLGTPPDSPVLFRECGLTFEADVVRGQKTGHFLDQRDNRVRVAKLSQGARLLDVFASTGGFTVHAAAGGAREVVAVDLSEPTLAVAARNLAHNRALPAVAACRYRPEVGDAFSVMRRLLDAGERFDVVLVDPPSFAQRQDHVARALQRYGDLTGLAVGLLRRGGTLVQCSCSSRVSAEQFQRTVARAADAARRPLTDVRRTGHSADHPIGFPEGEYLKAVFATVG